MWLPPEQVGMIIDRGFDWLPWVQDQLDAFAIPLFIYRDDPSRLTTKALNTYTGELRAFKYLTPKRRLDPKDLASTRLLHSKYLHCVCASSRLEAILQNLQKHDWHPKIAYEPIPDLCIPEELETLRSVIGKVKIFSPNHEEAARFFGRPEPDQQEIEELCREFVKMGAENVVIRSGALGACGMERAGGVVWIPAYCMDKDAVVDPTGCGNAFIGGLMAGLSLSSDNLIEGMLHGSVSASLIIEQYGICSYDLTTDRWNGEAKQPKERLEELRTRLRSD